MNAIYPYRWAGAFTDVDAIRVAKNEWGNALTEFSDERIKHGLDVCRKAGNAFPPSIPEFVQMCRVSNAELGIVPEHDAYEIFQHNTRHWPHGGVEFCENDLIQQATRKALQENIRMLTSKEARKEFFRLYKIITDKFAEEKAGLRLGHSSVNLLQNGG